MRHIVNGNIMQLVRKSVVLLGLLLSTILSAQTLANIVPILEVSDPVYGSSAEYTLRVNVPQAISTDQEVRVYQRTDQGEWQYPRLARLKGTLFPTLFLSNSITALITNIRHHFVNV